VGGGGGSFSGGGGVMDIFWNNVIKLFYCSSKHMNEGRKGILS